MKSRRLLPALILFLVVAARAATWQVIRGAHVAWDYEYEVIASNLLDGPGFAYDFYGLTAPQPSAFQPPLYPVFLAGVRSLSSDLPLLPLTQIVLSLLSVYLLIQLTITLGGSRRQALLAGFLLAIYPPAVLYSVVPSPVTIETTLVLAGCYLAIRSIRSRSVGLPLAAGAALALAGLTRSPWLLLIPLTAGWLIWRSDRRGGSRWLPGLTVTGAALIILLPWGIYNLNTQGEFSVTSTNGGVNFWIGNNPQATGEYIFPTQINRELVTRVASWSEPRRDEFFYTHGFEYVRGHPVETLKLAGRKLSYFLLFRPSIGSSYQSADVQLTLARWLFLASWSVLLPLSIAGLWLARMDWRTHILPLSFVASQAAVAMVYFVGTRFRTPVDPLFMVWASGALVTMGEWWLDRHPGTLEHA